MLYSQFIWAGEKKNENGTKEGDDEGFHLDSWTIGVKCHMLEYLFYSSGKL